MFTFLEALHCYFHIWTSTCSNLCHFLMGHNLLWFYLNLGFLQPCMDVLALHLYFFLYQNLIFYIFFGSYKSPVYYWKPLFSSQTMVLQLMVGGLSLAQNSHPFWVFFFLRGLPVYWTMLLQLCSELNIRSQMQRMGKFEFGPWSTGDNYAAGKVLPVAHGWDLLES